MTVAPTPRYALLDALRGVAAIGVMFFHFGSMANAPIIVPHGYLAVDFFFVLSGFVVAHAYTERMDSLGWSRFFVLRIKRLLPMSIFGVLLGTAYLLVRLHFHPEMSDDLPHLLAGCGLNLFLIPKLWRGRATGHSMFPSNLVLWTLLLELMINLLWAKWFVRQSNRALMATASLGGLILVLFAWHMGTSGVGWNFSTFPGGVGRVTFGFFAGVLLWRFRPHARIPAVLGWSSAVALIAILCLPICPWWVEILVVFLVFPTLVHFAANVRTSDQPVYRWLGDVSYPLYAIHGPLVTAMATSISLRHFGAKVGLSSYLVCIPIVPLAYLVGRLYDVPIRSWLAKMPAQRCSRVQSFRLQPITDLPSSAGRQESSGSPLV
jgi:peptidoglycan/LPS O-acetylase OafA/YrhL